MEKSIQNLHILQTNFSLPLSPKQISSFRGAVAEAAGWEKDLFHNHDNTQVILEERESNGQQPLGNLQLAIQAKSVTLKTTYHYRYPLIQYRVMNGKASIWSIDKGTDALRTWLFTKDSKLLMGNREVPLLIEGMKELPFQLKMLPEMKGYRILDYLPFNDDNYKKWKATERLSERIIMLESILTGHILGFSKSMGYQLPERLEVQLLHIWDTKTMRLHACKRLAMGLVYKANIDLPPGLALGKGSSHGFGVQMPTRSKL